MSNSNNEDFHEDTSPDIEESTRAGSPGSEDSYGYPEVLPRVGKKYQAEIPSMMTDDDDIQLRQRWANMENMGFVDDFRCMQQAVPLTWIHDKSGTTKDQLADRVPPTDLQLSHDIKVCKDIAQDSTFMPFSGRDPFLGEYMKSCSSGSVSKFPYVNPTLKFGIDHTAYSCIDDEFKTQFTCMGNPLMWSKENSSVTDFHGRKQCSHLEFVNLKWHLVPGRHEEAWSEFEWESFLLGLYIFGKNLVQIQRFMETKQMGDILSFYYGHFFNSVAHRKWSEGRKIRSKRCFHGNQIFNGSRQQELLIRLMPHVSEESKDHLLEKIRAFNEGKVTLEEYVTMIKAAVGLPKLVEAVGLGKGKQDLTAIIAKPLRSKKPIVSVTKIPVGKACASLTSEEIIKFLTGGFRLSKARSNDLFWEAVWPRLLARGWHSEQPRSDGYSKHSLVFLIPGIRKFSRGKLVKGIHYFDSLSDVLHQVTQEPGLLEIEADITIGSGEADPKQGEKGLMDNHPHSYLRPRIPNASSENIKFMVVDTSMAYEEPYRMRDMRTLPIYSDVHSPASLSTDTDDNSPKELVDESVPAEGRIDVKLSHTKHDIAEKNASIQMMTLDGQLALSDQTSLRDVTDVEMVTTYILEQEPVAVSSRKKVHEPDYTANYSQNRYASPVSEKQRIYSRDGRERLREDHLLSTGVKFKDEGPPLEQFMVSSAEKRPTRNTEESEIPNTSIGGRCEISSGEVCLTSLGSTKLQEKSSPLCLEKACRRPLIDLNLPNYPSDDEMDDALDTQGVNFHGDHNTTRSVSFPAEISHVTRFSEAFDASDSIVGTFESTEHGRRQSTRNRPLTLRALEYLACGLWHTKRKDPCTKSRESDDPAPRPRRRRKKDTGMPSQIDSLDAANVIGTIIPPKEERINEECTQNNFPSDKGDVLGLFGLSNSSCLSEISRKDGQSRTGKIKPLG